MLRNPTPPCGTPDDPILSPARCDVYIAQLAMLRPAHAALLDPIERHRRDDYRYPRDRARFVLGAVLLRLVAGDATASAPDAVRIERRCDSCGKPHGRPRVRADAGHVSVAHAGDVVAVAITRAGPVGIDVEATQGAAPRDYRDLAHLVATDAERAHIDSARAFLTLWTRKEAVLKATGDGLRLSMTQVQVSAPTAAPALLSLRGARAPACVLRDIDAGPAHCGALAVLTRAKLDVTIRSAAALLGR